MLLKNNVAIVYGGSGAVGGAIAKSFAKEGAIVIVAGRTSGKLEKIVNEIKSENGIAEAAVVDAHDREQVNNHFETVLKNRGRVDVFFNAVGIGGVQGSAMNEMNYEDFALPVINAVKSQFVSSVAAAKYMAKQGGGVILTITANAARKPYPDTGGFGVACAAIEGFCRQLALENGKYGVRVVCLRSAGSPDTPGVDEVFNLHAANAGITREQFDKEFADRTMLKRLPLLREIAEAAVLMASAKASAITAAVLNVTCGEIAD